MYLGMLNLTCRSSSLLLPRLGAGQPHIRPFIAELRSGEGYCGSRPPQAFPLPSGRQAGAGSREADSINGRTVRRSNERERGLRCSAGQIRVRRVPAPVLSEPGGEDGETGSDGCAESYRAKRPPHLPPPGLRYTTVVPIYHLRALWDVLVSLHRLRGRYRREGRGGEAAAGYANRPGPRVGQRYHRMRAACCVAFRAPSIGSRVPAPTF